MEERVKSRFDQDSKHHGGDLLPPPKKPKEFLETDQRRLEKNEHESKVCIWGGQRGGGSDAKHHTSPPPGRAWGGVQGDKRKIKAWSGQGDGCQGRFICTTRAGVTLWGGGAVRPVRSGPVRSTCFTRATQSMQLDY